MHELNNIPAETVPLNFTLWKTLDAFDETVKQEAFFSMDLFGQAQCAPHKFYKPIRPSFFLTVLNSNHGE